MDDALAIPALLRRLYTHHRKEGTGYLVVSGGVIGSITYIYYTVPEAYHRYHERNQEAKAPGGWIDEMDADGLPEIGWNRRNPTYQPKYSEY